MAVLLVPFGLLISYYRIYHPPAFWLSIAVGTILGLYLSRKPVPAMA